jgi:flagellar hook-associated protein 1 FlgK
MSGITFVLNIAREALMAQQRGIQVTGHNIANVNTPEYTRQKLILTANAVTMDSRIKLGLGVKSDSVVQYFDRLTTKHINQRIFELSKYESKQSILEYLQGIFNEESGNGLNKTLEDFWNAWQDLADNPGGIAERTALLQKASNMGNRFQALYKGLVQSKDEMNIDLKISVNELNILAKQVASLNQRIITSEVSGTTANDLRDQRINAIEKMSKLVDTAYIESDNGSMMVLTTSGIPLVDENESWELHQNGDNIYWSNIPADISNRVSGGKIGAWMDLRDEIIPQYMADLDELAGTMIHQVNALHYIDGYTSDGVRNKYFFNHLNFVGGVKYGAWTGTSTATSGGDYTGRLKKSYTFTVPDGTVGTGPLDVDWIESTTGRTGSIRIPNGYVAGTPIHVDGVNSVVENSGWTGTSRATSSGNYTATTNQNYTFTVQSVNGGAGIGTIGTDVIVIHWQNTDNSTNGNITLDGAYAPDTAMTVENGLEVAFAAGTLSTDAGNTFTVETEQGPDVSFSAGTLVDDDTFSIDVSDYAGAAGSIALSSDVDGLPENIAASTAPGESGNNENALAIQGLQDATLLIRKWTYQRGTDSLPQDQSATMDEYYTIFVGDMGMLVEENNQNQSFNQTMIDQLNEIRDSISGVNLDEETVNLIKYQHAFTAASKLVTVCDEMLQDLLSMR